mgnify:CR=1 FL=1
MTTHSLLPEDGCAGTLVTRIWNPAGRGGPSVAVLRDDGVYDLSAHVATMSTLLDVQDPAAQVRSFAGKRVGSVDDLLGNSDEATRDSSRASWLMMSTPPSYSSRASASASMDCRGCWVVWGVAKGRKAVREMVPRASRGYFGACFAGEISKNAAIQTPTCMSR